LITDSQPTEPIDPYDPDALRVASIDDIGVVHEVISIAVRKPDRKEFFRVHPELHLDCFVLEFGDGDVRPQTYLVTPRVHAVLIAELVAVRLFCCINKYGTKFLWPAKLPSSNGRQNRWHDSALVAADKASVSWIRMFAAGGAYELQAAQGDLGTPDWPSWPLREWLRLGFKDEFLINDVDHPVIRALNGDT
jgi:hypothetical protein